jgi:hypothetical protein
VLRGVGNALSGLHSIGIAGDTDSADAHGCRRIAPVTQLDRTSRLEIAGSGADVLLCFPSCSVLDVVSIVVLFLCFLVVAFNSLFNDREISQLPSTWSDQALLSIHYLDDR